MSSRSPSFVKSLSLASVACFMLAGTSLAQVAAPPTYKEYPPDANLLANKKAGQQQVSRIMRAQQQSLDDKSKAVLDAYYRKIIFREFTTKENWGRLPELRDELLRDLRGARNPQALQYLMALTFQQMQAFTQSKFALHPAVRYNAMLLLGELNASERGAKGADGRPSAYPDPLPAALDAMVAEYQNPDQIDAVRVAALVGIDRHAKLDLARPENRRIAGAKKKVIVDEMLALLNAVPPEGRTAAGHTWMQRRAIDILGALGMVGVYPEANAALERIVADKKAPISLRCTASEALAQWAPNSNKIDASAVSRNLGLIAVKACKDELDRMASLVTQEEDMKKLRELIKKANPAATGQFGGTMAGGGEGMMQGAGGEMYGGGGEEMYGGGGAGEDMYGGGGEMMGGDMGMYGGMMPGGLEPEIPTDPRIIWSQRRLKYQLTCVKRGLDGMVIAGKASPHEKVVDQVSKAVQAALKLTDPPADKPDLEGLTKSIQKGIRGLAFLAPEVAEHGSEPVTDLPVGDLPPGAAPPADASIPPDGPAVPASDPTAPPDAGLPDLPPGVE
ncbi:MAG: hypothetical protein WD070_11715 [Pirellulaceae bacterium]